MEVAPLRAIYWIYETSIISMKLLVTIIDVFPDTLPATIIIILITGQRGCICLRVLSSSRIGRTRTSFKRRRSLTALWPAMQGIYKSGHKLALMKWKDSKIKPFCWVILLNSWHEHFYLNNFKLQYLALPWCFFQVCLRSPISSSETNNPVN